MKQRLLPLAGCLILLPRIAFGQGDLTPPGPPGPTMKSLDQVDGKLDQANSRLTSTEAKIDQLTARAESRIPLSEQTTPGNENFHFIITQPGSYYLTGNLVVTKNNGIHIDAAGVTLDLNGFEISRSSGPALGTGIFIASASHRASILNGSIRHFADGTFLELANPPKATHFRHLSVSECTGTGIFAGPGAVLESCRANDNGGPQAVAGIFASYGATLINCVAYNNTAQAGIQTGSGVTLANCVAYNNTGIWGIRTGHGATLINCSAHTNTVTWGIDTGSGSVLNHCSATANTSSAAASAGFHTFGATVSHCSANGNTSTATGSTASTGMGFNLGAESTIVGCTAHGNKGDGIRIAGRSVARENTSARNGVPPTAPGPIGRGIHATGNGNRIEANNTADNHIGIKVENAGNLIIKNSSRGGSDAYDIAAGNSMGEEINVFNATTTTVINNSNPWANFLY